MVRMVLEEPEGLLRLWTCIHNRWKFDLSEGGAIPDEKTTSVNIALFLGVSSGTATPSGTSLAGETALRAPALTKTPPTLPLRWPLPLRSWHSVVAGCAF